MYQLDKSVLQLSQLILQRAVLGESATDGGFVRLNILQHASAVLLLVGLALNLPLQLPQTCLLLGTQTTQLLVISQLKGNTPQRTVTETLRLRK